jgi:hypothetical protein
MSAPTWWTVADEAELALRARDLVDAISRHGGCAHGCDVCRGLIQDVVDWRDRRVLKSRAEHLRREQFAADMRLGARARLARTPVRDLVQLLRETNPYREAARAA